MAVIDHTIYFNQKAPDLVGNFEKGLRLGDLDLRRKKQRQIEDAYNQGISRAPDGSISFDKNKTLSALVSVGGLDYLKAKQEMEASEAQTKANKLKYDINYQKSLLDYTTNALPFISDQNSYNDFLKKGEGVFPGFMESFPQEYNPKFNQDFQNKLLNIKDKVDMDYKRKSLELQERRLDREEIEKVNTLREKQLDLKTPYGPANNPQDAKDLKEVYESKKSFDSKIDEMIALRKKHKGGAVLAREDIARGKQLSKDLLLQYKNMAKLGVLSKADEDIINAIIPADPLEYDFLPYSDPILHKLEKFKADSEKDFQTKLNTRLRGGTPNVSDSQAQTKVIGDNTYRKVEGGWQLME